LVGAGTTASIQSVGNGWYRCTMTATATATASGSFIAPCLVTSTTSSRAESNSLSTSVFVWGAQLVEGTEPLDYLPTTDRLDIARIDYSTGEPALLLEPQRTNDGTQNADTFTFTSTVNSRVEKTVFGLTSGATYTWSVYLKTASGTLPCRIYGIDATNGTAITVTDQWVRYSITRRIFLNYLTQTRRLPLQI
jgi:hypothetical protein